MTCPDCGKSYSDTAPACINCGYNTRSYTNPKNPKINVSNLDAFFLYIVSFLIPAAGLLIGAIYVSKTEADYKDVGQACLLFALINVIFTFFIFFVMLAWGGLPSSSD